jgi:glycerol dehydrogenase-like iron-containing ADH family enzyme
VAEHQRRTIERYDALRPLVRSVYLMPVLQGYLVHEYLDHLEAYGERLAHGAYVGVGSICKRNGSRQQIEGVLTAIMSKRPDLRLHGFGLKTTALASDLVRRCLASADSMAWSYAARREGRNQNDPQEAVAFAERIERQRIQGWLFER